MRNAVGLFVAALILGSCAGTNSGVTMMISEDTALITVMAKGRETTQLLVDATITEAAKVTRAHGFRYFVVLATEDASTVVVRRRPGETVPNQATGSRGGTNNLSSVYWPGATYTLPDKEMKERRLGLDVTIRMFLEGAVDPMREGVWNSDTVLARAAR